MPRTLSLDEMDKELEEIFLPSIGDFSQKLWPEAFEGPTTLQEETLVDYPEENHLSGFDANFVEQIGLNGLSDDPRYYYQAPPALESTLIRGPSPLESNRNGFEVSYGITSSDTVSSGSLSPATLVSSLPSKTGTSLQVVQYRHTDIQKKQASKSNRSTRTRSKEKNPRVLTSRVNVLKTDAAPKTFVKHDTSGRVACTTAVFGLDQIVRAPASSESRRATLITRRLGACQRCHKNRSRCDMSENMYDPCACCMKVVYNFYLRNASNYQHQPCMRIDLLDLHLHRKGPTIHNDLLDWVQKKQSLLTYQHISDTQELFLSQGFGGNALNLIVSRFEPGPGDRTTYFWTDLNGKPCSMVAPPYFISDLIHARESIRQFFQNVRSTYIETLIADTNPLVRQTFQAALIYAAFGSSKLVSEALDVWVAARFIETQWRVIGNGEKIGLEPQNEPGHPFCGFTPVTPIMDTQLDDLVIRDLLVPFTARFLKSLKDKIDEKRRENWLEIYFALFIMMSNIGWTVKDMITHATWKGLKAGSRGGTLTQGYMHACKTMLAYFHFACAGSYPLSIAFDKTSTFRGRDSNGMTRDQIEYLESIQQMMSSPGAKFREWKDLSMYGDDSYWCYQLLSLDWRGDIPHAGEIDDFREEDFLSSSVD